MSDETKWRYDVKAGDVKPSGYQYRSRGNEHGDWVHGSLDGQRVSGFEGECLEYRFPATDEPEPPAPAEAPLPPGWVRLTAAIGSNAVMLRTAACCDVSIGHGSGNTLVGCGDDTWQVRESPAEVLALIAEAQRAERRFSSLPMMATTLYATGGMGTEYSVEQAAEILDAIEARERGDD